MLRSIGGKTSLLSPLTKRTSQSFANALSDDQSQVDQGLLGVPRCSLMLSPSVTFTVRVTSLRLAHLLAKAALLMSQPERNYSQQQDHAKPEKTSPLGEALRAEYRCQKPIGGCRLI